MARPENSPERMLPRRKTMEEISAAIPQPPPARGTRGRDASPEVPSRGPRKIATGALAFLGWIYVIVGVMGLLAGTCLGVVGFANQNGALFASGIAGAVVGLVAIGLGEAARVLVELERRTRDRA